MFFAGVLGAVEVGLAKAESRESAIILLAGVPGAGAAAGLVPAGPVTVAPGIAGLAGVAGGTAPSPEVGTVLAESGKPVPARSLPAGDFLM